MTIPALPFCHVTLTGQKPLPKAYPKELKTIGDHLRKRRLDLGLLQREVAERIGVDEVSVYNWENNRSSPGLRYMPKIIEFLGLYNPPSKEASTFGEKIVGFHRALAMTQESLAIMLGLDPTTLAHWERGEHQPTRRHRERLSALMNDPSRRPRHSHELPRTAALGRCCSIGR